MLDKSSHSGMNSSRHLQQSSVSRGNFGAGLEESKTDITMDQSIDLSNNLIQSQDQINLYNSVDQSRSPVPTRKKKQRGGANHHHSMAIHPSATDVSRRSVNNVTNQSMTLRSSASDPSFASRATTNRRDHHHRSRQGQHPSARAKAPNPNLEPVAGFNALPLIHNQEDVVKTKEPSCQLCLAQFRSLKNPLRKKHHNCAKCGISVCEECSNHQIKLSQQDSNLLRTCNRCYSKMQNEALINFYQGLLSSKNSQISSLDTRKGLIKERIAHFQKESVLIEREMQQNAEETDEAFGKLLAEYKSGSDTILALKDKYKNMQSLQIVEEDQIKNKNRQISQLQEELQNLKMQAVDQETNIRNCTQEVNAVIFQIEKYKNATGQISMETQDTIDKYKQGAKLQKLNDDRDQKQKARQQEASTNAIPEVQNEFSQVTESAFDRASGSVFHRDACGSNELEDMNLQTFGNASFGGEVARGGRPASMALINQIQSQTILEEGKEDCSFSDIAEPPHFDQ